MRKYNVELLEIIRDAEVYWNTMTEEEYHTMLKHYFRAVSPWDDCGHEHHTYEAAQACGLRTFGRGIQVRIVRFGPRRCIECNTDYTPVISCKCGARASLRGR